MKKLNSFMKLWLIFIVGALIPVATSIILNLGLIFQWPYPFDFFYDLIYNLSTKNSESLDSDYLIGIASSFIVFFAIASWIYSFNYITPNIVRKYILKHNITFLYFGIQIGYGLSLSYFTYFIFHYNYNYVLSIAILVLSIVTSVVYFYWLSKIILPRRLFTFLLNKINFKHLGTYEKKIKDKIIQLEENTKKSKLPFKTKLNEFFLLFNKNITHINWDGVGYVKDININCIEKLLEKYIEKIKFILILAMIGDSLPKGKLYKPIKEKSKSILLTIKYKTVINSTEDSIEGC